VTKEVVLFEGFFNRLNGLVNGRLAFGDQFRVRWAINKHLPHRFSDLFEDIPGVEVEEVDELGYWPENLNPETGPLCYWFIGRNLASERTRIEQAYRYFFRYLKTEPSQPAQKMAIHYRGYHHSAHVDPRAFLEWCHEKITENNLDQVFVVCDSKKELIEESLQGFDIKTNWGRSRPMSDDFDRGSLQGTLDFIADILTLANCDTVLSSFAETTIVDPAHGLGRRVISYSGSRDWCECWFHHHQARMADR